MILAAFLKHKSLFAVAAHTHIYIFPDDLKTVKPVEQKKIKLYYREIELFILPTYK